MHRDDRVAVASEELLLQDLDGDIAVVVEGLTEVYLAGVSFAKGLEDFVSLVENWVS